MGILDRFQKEFEAIERRPSAFQEKVRAVLEHGQYGTSGFGQAIHGALAGQSLWNNNQALPQQSQTYSLCALNKLVSEEK